MKLAHLLHAIQACPVKREIIEWGREIYRKLMNRVEDDPFYAVAYTAFQGAPAQYETQLRAVEMASKIGAEEIARNPEIIGEISSKTKAAFRARQGELLKRGAECYLEICGENPRQCTADREKRAELADCMLEPSWRKTRDLLLLMLGDEDAVPVDRHVARWTCEIANLYCPEKYDKKRPVKGREAYEKYQEAVKEAARACEVAPAELMVTAWALGICLERWGKKHGMRRPAFPIVQDEWVICPHQETLETFMSEE
ncbi:MAG: hypothetical protein QXG35_00580 [Nitrososphaerota archaeon]